MGNEQFIPLESVTYSDAEMFEKASEFFELVNRRRTVRDFSDASVPQCVIERCIHAAGTAPSGANQQPWHFVLVADPDTKSKIREAAEIEEREFYESRATSEWLDALAPIGTDSQKPFLETAPYLIAVFVQKHEVADDGSIVKHYYPTESVGIATGILITALHQCGLATLTHTPSPMKFLNQILGRPESERPFVLLVTGHAADDAKVPNITRKSFNDICSTI